MKNKIVAAVLAFFLGGFGIHQFYLGNNSKGILYLVFCWTFIPSVIGFIDGIILISMNDNIFDLKYNNGISSTIQYTNKPVNVAEQIEKLYNLRTRGVITQQEYEQQKSRIMA